MNRRGASSDGRPRIAVVGAVTVDGSHLRAALVKHGVPGARVDLYGTTEGEVVLSDYGGEARMIQEPDLEDLARHELIFLCEHADAALADAVPGSVIIDLHGASPAQVSPLGLAPHEVARDAKCFAVPHPMALVLAEVLHPLHRELGLAEATAVVIRPASDFGRKGVEELRDQAVCLLSFSQVPVTTFGRQLAFNIVPDALLPVGQRGLESRINREVADLLGWADSHFAVKLLAAAVFYGHGLQLHFRLARDASLEEVRSVLEHDGLLRPSTAEAAATPLDVTDEMRTSLSELAEDGMGAYWLWGVAGETAANVAQRAVRLAATLFDL